MSYRIEEKEYSYKDIGNLGEEIIEIMDRAGIGSTDFFAALPWIFSSQYHTKEAILRALDYVKNVSLEFKDARDKAERELDEEDRTK